MRAHYLRTRTKTNVTIKAPGRASISLEFPEGVVIAATSETNEVIVGDFKEKGVDRQRGLL